MFLPPLTCCLFSPFCLPSLPGLVLLTLNTQSLHFLEAALKPLLWTTHQPDAAGVLGPPPFWAPEGPLPGVHGLAINMHSQLFRAYYCCTMSRGFCYIDPAQSGRLQVFPSQRFSSGSLSGWVWATGFWLFLLQQASDTVELRSGDTSLFLVGLPLALEV